MLPLEKCSTQPSCGDLGLTLSHLKKLQIYAAMSSPIDHSGNFIEMNKWSQSFIRIVRIFQPTNTENEAQV